MYVQVNVPKILTGKNCRYVILLTPATIGTKVRTNGTQHASVIARGPYLSQNSSVRMRFSFLKRRVLGLSNSLRPIFLPNRQPVLCPNAAEMNNRNANTWTFIGIGPGKMPCWNKKPAVNSRLSPGKRKPNSKPDSAYTTNMMANTPRPVIKLSNASTASYYSKASRITCFVL